MIASGVIGDPHLATVWQISIYYNNNNIIIIHTIINELIIGYLLYYIGGWIQIDFGFNAEGKNPRLSEPELGGEI